MQHLLNSYGCRGTHRQLRDARSIHTRAPAYLDRSRAAPLGAALTQFVWPPRHTQAAEATRGAFTRACLLPQSTSCCFFGCSTCSIRVAAATCAGNRGDARCSHSRAPACLNRSRAASSAQHLLNSYGCRNGRRKPRRREVHSHARAHSSQSIACCICGCGTCSIRMASATCAGS